MNPDDMSQAVGKDHTFPLYGSCLSTTICIRKSQQGLELLVPILDKISCQINIQSNLRPASFWPQSILSKFTKPVIYTFLIVLSPNVLVLLQGQKYVTEESKDLQVCLVAW